MKTDLRSELKSELKGELKSELKTIKIILDLIRENPEATIDVLVKKSGKSRTTVQKCVRKLKEGLCIEREGGKRHGILAGNDSARYKQHRVPMRARV